MKKILIISIIAFFSSGCSVGSGTNGSDWVITNTLDEVARQAGQAVGGYGTGKFEWDRVQHRGAWEGQHALGRILQEARRQREATRRRNP